METGGGGKSTVCLARAALLSDSYMVTIEQKASRLHNRISNVDYQVGWSVAFNDIIKKGHKLFVDMPDSHKRKKYKWADRNVALYGKKFMKGPVDLIRKVVVQYGQPVDFFFCDTGEYCGLAEWHIIKDILLVGSKFACHDIYYPKSIKCFQVVKQIEKSNNWRVLVKTNSKQGLLIAEKYDANSDLLTPLK